MESSQPKAGGLLHRIMNAAKPAEAAAPAAAPAPAGVDDLFGGPPAAKSEPAAPPPPALAPAAPAPAGVDDLFGGPPAKAAPAPAPAAPVDTAPTGGITPPDAPSPVSTKEEIAAADAANRSAPEEKPAPAASPETTAEAAAPARRKRRTKAEMEAARAAEAAEAAAKADAAVLAPAPAAPIPAAPVPAVETAPTTAPAPTVAAAPATAPVTAFALSPDDAFGTAKNDNARPTPITIPEDAPADQVLELIRQQLTNPDEAYACPVQVLFIDCKPGKGWPGAEVRELSEFMHAFERAAADSAKALDYRLIRFESKGWLTVAMKILMRGLPPAIFVDTSLPGADVFINVVTPYVKAIFRGTR